MRWILLLIPFLAFSQYGNNGPVYAFPGAEGAGRIARGGRGGVLIRVNTLDETVGLTGTVNAQGDSVYTGGLYAALRHPTPAYVIFDVSGNIVLPLGDASSTLSGTMKSFSNFRGMPGAHHKTVFGQSAPRGGITITNGAFKLDGTNNAVDNDNLIFRYIRSRPKFNRNGVLTDADDAGTWALHFQGGDSIVVDHCSLSWAQDKAVGGFMITDNVTNGSTMYNHSYTRNIIAASATGGYVEINPGRAGNPENHTGNISFTRNLFIANNRTPNLGFQGTNGNFGERVNNVIYDAPSYLGVARFGADINEIGNRYLRASGDENIGYNDAVKPSIYTANNFWQGTLDGVTINYDGSQTDNSAIWQFVSSTTPLDGTYFTATKHSYVHESTITSSLVAYEDIVIGGDVGAWKYLDDSGDVQVYRDDVDTAHLNAVLNDTGWTRDVANWNLPALPNNTRPAGYDTDNDGMADAWENEVFGNLSQGYSGDFDGDGYTNIEEYMNQVDGIVIGGGGGTNTTSPDSGKNATSAMLISH